MGDKTEPLRADHRFIQKVIKLSLAGKVLFRPEEFDRLARVFSKMGGSWVRIFSGSPEDISKLKKLIKAAYKHGYLTKAGDWGKGPDAGQLWPEE